MSFPSFETGKTRRSSSILIGTPYFSNQLYVPSGVSFESDAFRKLAPRVYCFLRRCGSRSPVVMLHRPPPAIRTFTPSLLFASNRRISQSSPDSIRAATAIMPAAPPPMIATDFFFDFMRVF